MTQRGRHACHGRTHAPLARWRLGARVAAAALFIAAGANHFLHPDLYKQIVPPALAAPGVLVAISGACEIVGGLGLLVPSLRVAAGWGLLALLLAVFPANVYMAWAPHRAPQENIPVWLLWLRLPLQGVLMAWVWWVALDPRGRRGRRPGRMPPRPPT